MTSELEQEYLRLSKKYKLPGFNALNEEFEIIDLESKNFILKNILRKAAEKLEFYSSIINDLIQPDASSLSGMHETRFFLQNEKNSMYVLFKKLMKSYRAIIILVLEGNEKKEAKFLNDFFAEWLGVKEELISYLEKMRDSWDKETTIENDLGYFG